MMSLLVLVCVIRCGCRPASGAIVDHVEVRELHRAVDERALLLAERRRLRQVRERRDLGEVEAAVLVVLRERLDVVGEVAAVEDLALFELQILQQRLLVRARVAGDRDNSRAKSARDSNR